MRGRSRYHRKRYHEKYLIMASKQIVVATTNEHKVTEISTIVGMFGYDVISRTDAGVPDEFDVEEDGDTFEENSLLKARAVFDLLGGQTAALADDSGLCVDALDGAPGVYSARFADEDRDFDLINETQNNHPSRGRQDLANNAKLLRLLEEGGFSSPQDRTARFVSVITLIMPGDEPEIIVCRGEVEGHVDFRESGDAGFGYDPMFIPATYELQNGGLKKYEGKSFGLFLPEDKNLISHRFRALEKLRSSISDLNL